MVGTVRTGCSGFSRTYDDLHIVVNRGTQDGILDHPHSKVVWYLVPIFRLRLTCTASNVRRGLAVHNEQGKKQETNHRKCFVRKKKQGTLKILELTPRGIPNGYFFK